MMGQCYLCLGAGEYVPIRRQWFGVTIEAHGRTFKSTVKVEGGETGAVLPPSPRKSVNRAHTMQLSIKK